jgi:hypothetical protein
VRRDEAEPCGALRLISERLQRPGGRSRLLTMLGDDVAVLASARPTVRRATMKQ